ncbi:MAG: hypothetical protein KME38_10420 [Spirirestis rafaelensis WJT71-NPBG6]|jgi:hypothetical protein|nr:hypothetical protein [Spirirestis rafaelensis WJT71-NPBG6]
MAINLFDANFYRAANPDLGAAGLTTDSQLRSHFDNFGLNEGRRFSLFADLSFYRASNSDLGSFNNRQLYDHLQNNGVQEGRQFSPFVDLDYYMTLNPDVTQAYNGSREGALDHLQRYGLDEGRQFSPFVGLQLYGGLNSDLSDFNNRQLFEHLQRYGLNEGRLFDDFVDLNVYLNANPDINQAFNGNRELALQHLQIYGLNEGRTFSRFFDTNYYKSNNPDLSAAGFTGRELFNHFESYGLYFEARPGRSDVAGNTFNTATNITVNSSLNYYIDYLGASDTDDYYQFVLNQPSTFFLGVGEVANNDLVQNMLGSAFGELLDSTGQVLASGNYTTQADDLDIVTPLQPGTYYLHFRTSSSGGDNYAFVIAAIE